MSSSRKAGYTPKAGDGPVSPFRERVEAERRRIFNAMGIIDCCRCAQECLSDHDDECPDIASALMAAHELLDQVAGELGSLADEEGARRDKDLEIFELPI